MRGGVMGEGHSWVAAPAQALPVTTPEPSSAPAPAPQAFVGGSGLEQRVLEAVRRYIPEVSMDAPLAEQGLDSLAALELRQVMKVRQGQEPERKGTGTELVRMCGIVSCAGGDWCGDHGPHRGSAGHDCPPDSPGGGWGCCGIERRRGPRGYPAPSVDLSCASSRQDAAVLPAVRWRCLRKCVWKVCGHPLRSMGIQGPRCSGVRF